MTADDQTSEGSTPPAPPIPVATISPQLEYERGPTVGKLAIDDTADGVAVRVAAPARRPIKIVYAAAMWGVLATMGYAAARSSAVRAGNLSGWLRAFGTWFAGMALVAWFIWPRRWPIMFVLATPRGLEITPRGKPPLRLDRDQIEHVTTFMSPPVFFWTARITVAAVLVNGETIALGRGSLEECEAMLDSIRRGMGMQIAPA